jgi:hypothetical protein
MRVRSRRPLWAFNALRFSLLAAMSACATAPRAEEPAEVIHFDNATPDVVRVILKVDQHEILLGRVQPLSEATFRLRPAMSGGMHGSAMLIVVPLGAPSLVRSTDSPLAVRSDVYPMGTFSTISWRYSGSLILPFGPYR